MFDYLAYNDNDGDHTERDLLLFTLSTCSFCAEALQFLKDHNFRFRWVATDELPFNLRRKLRNEFIRTFKERMYYPTLVVDGAKVLSGFEVDEWQEELEIKER